MASPDTTRQRAPAAPSSHGVGRGPRELVMLVDPRSAAAEAYRALRINVEFSHLGRNARSIAVVSAGVKDGKAAMVANLAIALAEGGKRVILVDADLRSPFLHTLFGVENHHGLSTALADGGPLPLQTTSVPGLQLLPSGPTPGNPSELLGSRRLEHTLGALVDAADLVLFDTAPAASYSDAAILVARVDAVLLLVGLGKTRRDEARQVKEQIERVNPNILGVTLAGDRS